MLGSGFIVSKDGKLVTNLHVVKDMKVASVQMSNGEVFDTLSVLATDERRDLAVLQIAGFELPVLELGNSDVVSIGEPLIVVGSPRGLEGTVTAGILSSIRESGDGFKVLQTDAAVNPGNSGGPLVNRRGQAIGVVSSKVRSSENLNFAMPINYVRGLMNALHEPMTLEQMRQALVVTPSTENGRQGISLKETLDWLNEKIPLGIVRYAYLSGGAVSNTEFYARAWSLDSCLAVVGFEQVNHVADESDNIRTDITNGHRYKVALGDISSGKVTPDNWDLVDGTKIGYQLVLTTRSSEILLESYHEYRHLPGSKFAGKSGLEPAAPIRVNSAVLFFPDEALALRIRDAFLHAANQCRTKEPF